MKVELNLHMVLQLKLMAHFGINSIDTMDLIKYSNQLHKLYETACNRELTLYEVKKQERLEAAVNRIANTYNLVREFKTDPRAGCGFSLTSPALDQTIYINF